MKKKLENLVACLMFLGLGMSAHALEELKAHFVDLESSELVVQHLESKIFETRHSTFTLAYSRFLRLEYEDYQGDRTRRNKLYLMFSDERVSDYLETIETFLKSVDDDPKDVFSTTFLQKHLSFEGIRGARYLYFNHVKVGGISYLAIGYSKNTKSRATLFFDSVQSRELVNKLLELN